MMIDENVLNQCVEIMNACAKTDSALRKCWTGDPKSIVSSSLKTVRRLTVEIEAHKREKRMDRASGSKPWSPKSEPSSIDLWNDYKGDDWIGYGWEHVDDFWEECASCEGTGRKECSSCDGRGYKTCPNCEGDGRIVRYE